MSLAEDLSPVRPWLVWLQSWLDQLHQCAYCRGIRLPGEVNPEYT
jgi:hypothetical protein